jgi:hypothetical protein
MWDPQTIYGKPLQCLTCFDCALKFIRFHFSFKQFCFVIVLNSLFLLLLLLLLFYCISNLIINLRPWSYDTCSRGSLQHQQEFSACNKQTHFDFLANKGRGKLSSILMVFVHVACSTFPEVRMAHVYLRSILCSFRCFIWCLLVVCFVLCLVQVPLK